jgi:hypothetical protein
MAGISPILAIYKVRLQKQNDPETHNPDRCEAPQSWGVFREKFGSRGSLDDCFGLLAAGQAVPYSSTNLRYRDAEVG